MQELTQLQQSCSSEMFPVPYSRCLESSVINPLPPNLQGKPKWRLPDFTVQALLWVLSRLLPLSVLKSMESVFGRACCLGLLGQQSGVLSSQVRTSLGLLPDSHPKRMMCFGFLVSSSSLDAVGLPSSVL